MSVVAGDVLEVTYSNANVGDGTFYVKAGEDVEIDEGGFRNDDDQSAISGDGQMIRKMNQQRWMVSGVSIVWDMLNSNEKNILVQLAEDLTDTDFSFRHISGTIWSGLGTIVGDIKGSTQDALVPTSFSGGNKLEKVV